MLLRMIYDDKLAEAAYLIGCQRTGEAILFDPERDIDRYLELAKKEGVRIVAVAETHIHADFLSGTRELAERTGAKVYVSGEGGPDWLYGWLDKRADGKGAYDHTILKDGDTFRVGNAEFRAVHTPGHTPEHICYLVTDRGGGATEPMGIITGDFVFVGDLGRPDLLETAAGHAGAKEPSARKLYASLRRFLDLPDYLQVWPAHGAGSACGKALGAVPQTTVGYERRFNPAVQAATSESGFVDFILSGQPEPPMYFATMKRLNKVGPPVLGGLPKPRRLSPEELRSIDTREVALVDTRPWDAFRAGHVPGSLFIPMDNSFPAVAGSYIREHDRIVLIVPAARVDEAVRDLIRIGLDHVEAYLDPADLPASGLATAKLDEITVAQAQERMERSKTFVLDVRRASEYEEGHIAGALNVAHTRLPEHMDEIPADRPIIVHCRSGARSARAAAYLQRAGYDVANLAGGMLAWEKSAAAVAR